MTEKDLIKQLNNLKNKQADSGWKDSNREILISQIFNSSSSLDSSSSLEWLNMFFDSIVPRRFIKNVSHSFVALSLVLLVVFGGGIMSLKAAQNTKPGDSLYIAKIISEKARASLTFDEKEKAKLSLEFASNRAKEIKQVLKDDDGDKQEKVEKLTKDLKKEIKAARERVEKIIAKKTNEPTKKVETKEPSKESKSQDNEAQNETQDTETGDTQTKASKEKSNDNKEESNDDNIVFSANLSKDTKGIQVGEDKNRKDDDVLIDNKTEDSKSKTATNTQEAKENKTEEADNESSKDSNEDANPEEILEEAGKLLEEENYNEILNKLETINKIIDNQYNEEGNDGEVKGEFESASSSEEVEPQINNNEASSTKIDG